MTFKTRVWLGVGVFALLYGALLCWCLYLFPSSPAHTVTNYAEVDVSQLQGKRSAPGRLSPETVQKQEVRATQWLLNQWDYRDPFERVK